MARRDLTSPLPQRAKWPHFTTANVSRVCLTRGLAFSVKGRVSACLNGRDRLWGKSRSRFLAETPKCSWPNGYQASTLSQDALLALTLVKFQAARRSVTAREETPMRSPGAACSPFCWICDRPVSLEKSQKDEYGNIVHAECQTTRLKLKEASSLVQDEPE